jgi:AcrR family transcriptional regulator
VSVGPDGRRTRWDAHRAQRREQLVSAALEVLAEVGPDFGLEQVAARAGVTKPVVYRHYADRAGLIEAMGQRATAMLLERLVPAVQAHVALKSRIRMSIAAFLGFVDELPNVYRLFVMSASPGNDEVARTGKEIIARVLAGVLGDVLSRSGADDRVIETWSHGLVGFVQNAAEWWLDHRSMSRDDLTEHLTTLVWVQIDGFGRQYGIVLNPDDPPAR